MSFLDWLAGKAAPAPPAPQNTREPIRVAGVTPNVRIFLRSHGRLQRLRRKIEQINRRRDKDVISTERADVVKLDVWDDIEFHVLNRGLSAKVLQKTLAPAIVDLEADLLKKRAALEVDPTNSALQELVTLAESVVDEHKFVLVHIDEAVREMREAIL